MPTFTEAIEMKSREKPKTVSVEYADGVRRLLQFLPGQR